MDMLQSMLDLVPASLDSLASQGRADFIYIFEFYIIEVLPGILSILKVPSS
jgi:glycerol-3-phosphate responsive antiterminator